MKKTLKILGYTLGGLVLLLLVAASIIAMKPMPTHEVNAPDLQVDITADRVLEGKRLSMVLCNHCHMSKTGKLEGKFVGAADGLGDIYPPNITQHPTYGIASYTDGELFYLLRTGIKRDGKLAFPMMFRSLHMADEDIYNVIAYLRSDDPSVQPSEAVHPPFPSNFLVKMLNTLVFEPLPYSGQPVPVPAKEDKIAYGKYLVDGKFICFDCHSPSFETNNHIHPEQSAGYLQGGAPMYMEGMKDTIYSANITMDPDSGIGTWTEEEFITALTTGRKPDGTLTRYPMLPYTFMDSTEASAIYAYLQSIETGGDDGK